MAPKAINYGTYKQILNQGRRSAELPDVYYDKIPQSMRRIAFTASGYEQLSSIDYILKSLEKAEEGNITYEEWSAKFNMPGFQVVSEHRKQLIFRNYMTTQYNNGRLQVALNSDELKFLKYQAIMDDRTRPNHAANNGITLPANDDFWATNTPPIGHNCRCFVLLLSARDLENHPLTPAASLDNPALEPDKGFAFNKADAEKTYDTLFRQKAAEMPITIRRAAINRFLQKTTDLNSWWDINKKDFEKP